MRTKKRDSFGIVGAFTAGIVVISLCRVAAAADAVDCRSIEDNAERLACYDGLSSPPAPIPAPPPPPEAIPVAPPAESPAPQQTQRSAPQPIAEPEVAPAASAPVVLDDSVGKESVADGKDKEKVLIAGHVTSCREDNSGKYRFYFDNGQIWLQKDNKRVPWRECDFDVTLEKDFFGYKMLPVGEDKTIRISRIK